MKYVSYLNTLQSYSFFSLISKDIYNDWEFSPMKITFPANQSGSAIMYARPKDDDMVEGTERFVLSLKKISRKLVSHVQSKVVDIIDNDGR